MGRADLSAQRRQRSAGLVEFTMSEAANFWFLHTVNATIPVLMHFHNQPDSHPETVFPDHADTVIAWGQVLGAPVMPRLMWENAARFFRLTSTPWSNHEG